MLQVFQTFNCFIQNLLLLKFYTLGASSYIYLAFTLPIETSKRCVAPLAVGLCKKHTVTKQSQSDQRLHSETNDAIDATPLCCNGLCQKLNSDKIHIGQYVLLCAKLVGDEYQIDKSITNKKNNKPIICRAEVSEKCFDDRIRIQILFGFSR